jgi:hypothetical protein
MGFHLWLFQMYPQLYVGHQSQWSILGFDVCGQDNPSYLISTPLSNLNWEIPGCNGRCFVPPVFTNSDSSVQVISKSGKQQAIGSIRVKKQSSSMNKSITEAMEKGNSIFVDSPWQNLRKQFGNWEEMRQISGSCEWQANSNTLQHLMYLIKKNYIASQGKFSNYILICSPLTS